MHLPFVHSAAPRPPPAAPAGGSSLWAPATLQLGAHSVACERLALSAGVRDHADREVGVALYVWREDDGAHAALYRTVGGAHELASVRRLRAPWLDQVRQSAVAAASAHLCTVWRLAGDAPEGASAALDVARTRHVWAAL